MRNALHPGLGCWLMAAGLVLLTGCAGSGPSVPVAETFTPPPDPMPKIGSAVVFQMAVEGGEPSSFQWSRNGTPIPGATASFLLIASVSRDDAGTYQVKVTSGDLVVESQPFTLEPVDQVWVVRSTEDDGPGTLREVLAETSFFAGLAGIQFDLPGEGPFIIKLESDLPPVTQQVCILGSTSQPLVLDGGGQHRPFFVDGGTLILDQFKVAHGLAKGGSGLGGGGGAAGMGGALFLNKGTADLRRMVFTGNKAQGGSGLPGSDGESGGGGGFGGDCAQVGGTGGGGGFLKGEGGTGFLDGSSDGESGGGGIATPEGAGGGAVRGGPLSEPVSAWLGENQPGGAGSWGGGGGFSVGPEGGGGNAGFGAGGGGCGGRVPGHAFQGASKGAGGTFGGDGGLGDGHLGGQTGAGGGGAGMGGAIFFRSGSLRLHACTFTNNQTLAGQGAEGGLSKGGAIFIYAYDATSPYPVGELASQLYSGNLASDLVEEPSFDNNNYYIAQTPLARILPVAMAMRYQLYRLQKAYRWPVSLP